MKIVNLLFLFGLLAVITWSCSDSSSPTSANGPFAIGPHAEATEVPVQADSLSDLSDRIPGFGGLFINESGQLSIYLTQPADQKTTAKAVLSNSELLRKALSNSTASVSNIEVKKGQYLFADLHKWKKEVSGKVVPMKEVYTAGIDQSRNKLSIGVKNEDVMDKAAKKLEQLTVPDEAVLFYQMTPPEFLIGH